MSDGQQFRGTMERKRDCGLTLFCRSVDAVFGDESAADGKEGALLNYISGSIKGREAQAVGMLCLCAGRVHLGAIENQIAGFIEWNGVASGQIYLMRGADAGDGGRDGRWIDGGRLVAGEAEQHGAIRGMAQAGQGE